MNQTIYYFSIKMSEPLFSLTIRLHQNTIKLPVYQPDSLQHLITRICKASPDIHHLKLTHKLTISLHHLLQTKQLSTPVRAKITALTSKTHSEENAQTLSQGKTQTHSVEKDETSMNETPFKILQDSIINRKATFVHGNEKAFNYFQNNERLHMKYSENEEVQKSYLESNPAGNKKLINALRVDNKFDVSNRLLQKYEALDEKCSNYISQNILLQTNAVSLPSQSKLYLASQKSRNCKVRISNQQILEKQIRPNYRTVGQTKMQSFQQYKLNRNNFQANKNVSDEWLSGRQSARMLRPSKSTTKVENVSKGCLLQVKERTGLKSTSQLNRKYRYLDG